MVRVQQPYSKAVRQSLFNILGSVYNSSFDEQEGSTSGSLMLINALQDNVASSSHTRVSGNISTAHSSQQLDTSSKVSKAPSYGQLVGSIPTNRQSKFLGTVQTGDNVGTHMDSVASTGLSMTSSKLSDTSSQ